MSPRRSLAELTHESLSAHRWPDPFKGVELDVYSIHRAMTQVMLSGPPD